jgi:hypothetical protein
MEQTCILCQVTKPLEEFYKHPQMANGRLGRCKVCHRSEIMRNRNENIDRIRAYDRERGKTDARKQAFKAKNARKNKQPGYMKSHNALIRAVKSGMIVRPDHCSRCLIPGEPQAHHDDYSKPLDVMWLCPICHAARHKELGRLRTVETMKKDTP